jgi:tetratricopeptide (TPR) repeat protein
MYFVSKYDDDLETIPLAIPYSLAAADLYDQLDNQVSRLAALWSAASAYEHLEQFEEAVNHYLVVEQIADRLGMTLRQGKTLHNIAVCYEALNNRERAIDFCRQALPLMIDLSNHLNQAEIHKTLGENYFKLQQFENALYHFDKSLECYKKLKAHNMYVAAWIRILETQIRLQRWTDLESVFKICQAHQNALRDPDTKHKVMQIEAQISAHLGQHVVALSLLDLIDIYYREVSDLEGLATTGLFRSYSLSALNRHDEAVQVREQIQLLCEGFDFTDSLTCLF